MINSIIAVSKNGVIGRDNTLPWPHDKEDMRWFQLNTTNQTILMGRKTWESLPLKPLPKRENIVCTSSNIEGVETIKDLKKFIKNWPVNQELYIIGGKSIYEQTLDYVDNLILTKINGNYDGDAYIDIDKLTSNKVKYFEKTSDITGNVYQVWRK